MRAPSGDQLGWEFIERDAPNDINCPPFSSSTTICEMPRACSTATIRDPCGDQRGSIHCASMDVEVMGVMFPPCEEIRTSLVVAGTSCTATTSPSALTSTEESLAPRVSLICSSPRCR